MLIAQKLREENIAEYLLYMWQVEDIIRANKLDADLIFENIISKYQQSEEVKKEIREWFESLIDMMRREDKQNQGHLAINDNIIKLLSTLHLELLKSTKHPDYSSVYYKTLPYIVELRSKGSREMPEIETCFTALYGYLLMKMQQKEISGDTQAAIAQISNLLRLLSTKFKLDGENKLEL